VSLRDLTRAIVYLASPQGAALSGPVNACAPQPCTNAQFTAALGSALSRPAVVPVPEFAGAAIFGQMGQEMLFGGQKVSIKDEHHTLLVLLLLVLLVDVNCYCWCANAVFVVLLHNRCNMFDTDVAGVTTGGCVLLVTSVAAECLCCCASASRMTTSALHSIHKLELLMYGSIGSVLTVELYDVAVHCMHMYARLQVVPKKLQSSGFQFLDADISSALSAILR
jgi:Domain of unknown function (DUF1731)